LSKRDQRQSDGSERAKRQRSSGMMKGRQRCEPRCASTKTARHARVVCWQRLSGPAWVILGLVVRVQARENKDDWDHRCRPRRIRALSPFGQCLLWPACHHPCPFFITFQPAPSSLLLTSRHPRRPRRLSFAIHPLSSPSNTDNQHGRVPPSTRPRGPSAPPISTRAITIHHQSASIHH
jgi:hypothetical protein